MSAPKHQERLQTPDTKVIQGAHKRTWKSAHSQIVPVTQSIAISIAAIFLLTKWCLMLGSAKAFRQTHFVSVSHVDNETRDCQLMVAISTTHSPRNETSALSRFRTGRWDPGGRQERDQTGLQRASAEPQGVSRLPSTGILVFLPVPGPNRGPHDCLYYFISSVYQHCY
jgi:hypothetical protein